MPPQLPPKLSRAPILYLITSGETRATTTEQSPEFERLLGLCAAAVSSGISLIQLREKNLSARVLFELTTRAARLTRGSQTRLVVNDRADVARAGGADGVHLTTRSLDAGTVRRAFGQDFLIGVSTHTLSEAEAARRGGADFATFGPIFDTPSKRAFGPPVGLAPLSEAARSLAPFPLLALGGITTSENATEALAAGAQGIASIRLFSNASALQAIAQSLRLP
ncbi:MAG TPA: thiamine phosphate synthase [Pyrinomonadaceae bacterium]|jgi:thiamine-phosphate pyrophosphorylase